MARIMWVNEVYDVDDDTLELLFLNVIGEGEDLADYLASLNAEKRTALSDYIVYRLAEVSPGYVTAVG